jgi:hypothetical protein
LKAWFGGAPATSISQLPDRRHRDNTLKSGVCPSVCESASRAQQVGSMRLRFPGWYPQPPSELRVLWRAPEIAASSAERSKDREDTRSLERIGSSPSRMSDCGALRQKKGRRPDVSPQSTTDRGWVYEPPPPEASGLAAELTHEPIASYQLFS